MSEKLCIVCYHCPLIQLHSKALAGLKNGSSKLSSALGVTEKLEVQVLGRESAEVQRIAKIRRQKHKLSRRAKDKMLDAKQRCGTLKKLGARPGVE